MLNSKNIGALLRQALKAVDGVSPLSVSLLSPSGQPLCSVLSDKEVSSNVEPVDGEDGELKFDMGSKEMLRIYSLIASSEFGKEARWEILELSNGRFISLQRVPVSSGSYFLLMMVCDGEYSKQVAKLTLEKLSLVLEDGFKGYTMEQ